MSENPCHEVRFISNRKVERFGELFTQFVQTARHYWKFWINLK